MEKFIRITRGKFKGHLLTGDEFAGGVVPSKKIIDGRQKLVDNKKVSVYDENEIDAFYNGSKRRVMRKGSIK